MDIVDRECLDTCWERIRTRGRKHFIPHFGLRKYALPLGAALWLGLLVAVPVFLAGPDAPNFGYIGSRPFWLSLLASLILWPLAGYLWGSVEWRRRNRRYEWNSSSRKRRCACVVTRWLHIRHPL